MKFLVGYNGSKESKSALALASSVAKIHGAKIFVMTSMAGGATERVDEISKAEADLTYARKFLEEEGVECETLHFARGLSAGEDIVKFALDNEIDHLFVGIEKKSRTRKIILGSTAQYVILKAPCPVTTVK